MLRLRFGADCVVKTGKTLDSRDEGHIHAIADQSDCQYLCKAVQGFHGQVEGADSGLRIAAFGSIQPHHLVLDEAKTR